MNYFLCAGHRSWRWSDPGGVAVSVQPSTTLRRVHRCAHQWKSDRVHQGPGVAGTKVSQSQIFINHHQYSDHNKSESTNQIHQLFFINLQMSNLWTTINARLAVKDRFSKSDSRSCVKFQPNHQLMMISIQWQSFCLATHFRVFLRSSSARSRVSNKHKLLPILSTWQYKYTNFLC